MNSSSVLTLFSLSFFFFLAVNSLSFAAPFIVKPKTNKPKGLFAAFGAALHFTGKPAAGHSGEGWFPDVSRDLGTLREEQPRGLPLVCESFPFFLGFYIEKVLCCKYLALLPDVSQFWRLRWQCTGSLDMGCEDTCLHLSHCLYFLRHWMSDSKANRNSVYVCQFS